MKDLKGKGKRGQVGGREKMEGLPHDTIELQLGYLGSLEGICGEGITHDVLLCPLLELFDELVVDLLLDVDPRAGAAALPVIEVDSEIHP